MEFNNISLSVKNLEESIRFYRDVMEFAYIGEFMSGMGRAAMLDAGKIKITLFEAEKIPIGIFDFNLTVDNLDESLAELERKGAKVIMEPQRTGIGRMAKIWDPSGISIMLSELNKNGQVTDDRITHLPNKEK